MLKPKDLIIFGAGDLAITMAHLFDAQDSYNVCCFVCDDGFANCTELLGRPVVEISQLNKTQYGDSLRGFLAIGYKNMNNRESLYKRLAGMGWEFVNYISESAHVDQSVDLGLNNAIFPNATIEHNVTIGNNNIIWSNATLCHQSTIGSHCFLASNSVVGGFAQISDSCFLGYSSVVNEKVIVKAHCTLGSLGFLKGNTQKAGTYVGIPAKVRDND